MTDPTDRTHSVGEPAFVDLADAPPVGTPGPWTVFTDYLGGDDILVQADTETAEQFLTEALGMDLSAECGCDMGCGPIWSQREGANDDGSHPARPVSVEDEYGKRWNGGSRTTVYLAAVVATHVH